MPSMPKLPAAAAATLAVLMVTQPAAAHPHVWVSYALTVDYDGGSVRGVDHVWAFDDAYTEMALEGLDKNNDGQYDETELAELLKVNLDGLKEFNYFTVAKLAGAELAFASPANARLEYNNKILRLHFRLPLEKPVLADAEGLTFAVFDPSYFIAFEPEKDDPIKTASAPPGCTAALVEPEVKETDDQTEQLGAAMIEQFGGASVAFASHKTVAVSCKKS